MAIPRFGEVRHQTAKAHREAFLVGVDEAHAGHAMRHGARGLYDDTLVAADVEARLDHFARQEMHLLDRQRDILGLRRRAQARAGSQQAVDAFRQDHDIGVHDAAAPDPCEADHFAAASKMSSSAVVSVSTMAPASRTLRENHLSNCERMMV